MRVAKAISSLTEAFERLPGIGPKSAQRLTYYLLHVPQAELDRLANSIAELKKNTKQCHICQNISESDACDICADLNRDKSVVCVVEQPLNVNAMERGGQYNGVYHVLHGVIDPLHNIGPEELYIDQLIKRITPFAFQAPPPKLGGGEGGVQEVILALNPNMEGEATALYIKRMINMQFSPALREQNPMFNIKITRLAYGLPVGADIEYADEMTLNRALEGRRDY